MEFTSSLGRLSSWEKILPWLSRSSLLLGGGSLSLSRSLLGHLLLGSGLGLLGLGLGWLLGSLGLLGGQLEGSSSLLSSSSGSHDRLGVDQLLESDPHTAGGLSSVHLVVGADVLQDGLSGRSLLVPESLDGCLDHVGVGRMGSRGLGLGGDLLGLGSSGSSHDGL